MKDAIWAGCLALALWLTLVIPIKGEFKAQKEQLDSLRIQIDSLHNNMENLKSQTDSLWLIHPWKNPPKKRKGLSSNKICPSTFLGFSLWGVKSTKIDPTLSKALELFTGPKVKITSLRRHWGTKSKHECGKAVDLEFSHDLIEWLVTTEGEQWCKDHNIKFYIEAKPQSKALDRYKDDEIFKKFVFENKRATGPHIHLEIT